MRADTTSPPRPLFVYSLGFLRQARVRRILSLAGWQVRIGWPSAGDRVGVWGRKPVAARGRWVSARAGASLLTVEDGFLRSLMTGVEGAPPLSLILDDLGVYYDAYAPSRLEVLLEDNTPDAATTARARDGIAMLRRARLSKYTPSVPPRHIDPDFVLVVDQTVGDASIAGAGAGPETFRRMLAAARAENPGKTVLIKSHPDVILGRRQGHFGPADSDANTIFLRDSVNPWDLLEQASAVYTVSSQLGYEALLAGRPVRCFGGAFFAGWGLSEDEMPLDRRTRRLTVEALFAGCHLSYPVYYDPWRDRLTDFETVVLALASEARQATPEPDINAEVLAGVRLWKRRNVVAFRPRYPRPPVFAESAAAGLATARAAGRKAWIWASKCTPDQVAPQDRSLIAGYVEDGFLRSVGLGAELTEAASLVFDRQGIYFDPSAPSDLETLIAQAAAGGGDTLRAAALRRSIIDRRVSKYNTGQALPGRAPDGKRVVLIPGQVEDDASIQRGCGEIRTNLDLLKAARAANPDCWLIYKPHPDVEAGLRVGAIPSADLRDLANDVAGNMAAADALDAADELWTMTSLMGFEALLRGLPVTCLGLPFYAGWGLTRDLGPSSPRRTARPTLDQLVWAALIAYPRYRDPVTGLACPPELIVERLGQRVPGRRAGLLSKLQGMFASHSWIWRR